ncbi:hypothetical protein EBR21_12410 [bacterium]|nr:hypothetical protein [bacterium]
MDESRQNGDKRLVLQIDKIHISQIDRSPVNQNITAAKLTNLYSAKVGGTAAVFLAQVSLPF